MKNLTVTDLVAEDQALYFTLASLILFSCLPLSLFIIICILKVAKRRRTKVNRMILISRVVVVILLVMHMTLAVFNHVNHSLFCVQVTIVFPVLMLMEKTSNTAMVLAR